MLHERLQLIVEYLKAVECGQLPRNEVIFRQISTLCHRLPVIDSERFQLELHNQCSDIKLTAYLGALTKICGSVNQVTYIHIMMHFCTQFQLVGKLNVLSERQGTGGMRRVRGGMLL
jgi:COP9 signalosome complex subunit 6